MTKLLKDLLVEDYLSTIKAEMIKQFYNNSSLARRTGFSKAHIGNLLNGRGSDDALAAVCRVLGIDIRSLLRSTGDRANM